MLSRCVMDLLWMPENIVRTEGTRPALMISRDTVVRGIADREARKEQQSARGHG